MALLLFGPRQRAENWVRIVPILRSVAAGLLAWGLWTLLFSIAPKTQGSDTIKSGEWNHLVLVLDVSPSMRLEDAGPTGEQSRLHRSRDILNSIFSRVAMGHYRVSVVATYSGAMPVVVDTIDAEVLQNILGDLPMHHAFKKGETRLFDGLEEAVKIAKGWEPRSTTVIVLSDGDTVPPTDMPKMPPSVGGCLVVGVGDPLVGSFVGGRNSRQDVSTLRQIAARMNGSYHNGNKKHVASGILKQVTVGSHQALLRVWSRREYALMACFLGSALLALLPLLLHLLGTRFQPGRRVRVLTGRLNPS
ncbi:MAG: VWA domain-containing protein [bacterium]|nr:VWA domain-containing protein [bacterium]